MINYMGKLFKEKFTEVKTNKDFKKLQKENPDLDGYYIASASMSYRRRIFEKLYAQFEPYADRHFLQEVKKHFHQRTWEMYIACVLLKNNIRISSSDNGPDIKVSIGKKVIWIECVACSRGTGDDAVPPLRYDGSLQDLPEKQMLLRMTSSLEDKFKKYREYLEKGIIRKEDVFIIALNRADLDHFDPGIPFIFKALFGIGYLTIPINPLNGKKTESSPFWSTRYTVAKQNGKDVSVKFFEAQEHSGISAVIYSKDSVLNHPKEIGSECILVHNPMASNPLHESIFPFFEQYKAEEEKIKKI